MSTKNNTKTAMLLLVEAIQKREVEVYHTTKKGIQISRIEEFLELERQQLAAAFAKSDDLISNPNTEPIQLVERAKQLIEQAAKVQIANQVVKELELQKERDELILEFEEAFQEYLPLIKDAGITYTGFVRYADKCIVFQKDDMLKAFDFSSKDSYRYEDSVYKKKQYGSIMCYGAWPKDELIVYLYEAFFKSELQ